MTPRSFAAFAVFLLISNLHLAICFPPPPPPPDTEHSSSAEDREIAEEETGSTYPFPTDPPTQASQAASLSVGFHALLGVDQRLQHGEVKALQRYTQTKKGIFQIGNGYPFKILTGVFTATLRGIYQFTAIVHFTDDHERTNSSVDEADSHVTVSICIQGDCENNVALQSTVGITSKKFSVLVTGTMALAVQQSVSVFVTNNSGRVLVAKTHSSFMGHIIGAT